MSICAVTRNIGTGKSCNEDLYLQTIALYATDHLRHEFPKLFASLIDEMEKRVLDSGGNDVLGEYFEVNFARNNAGQVFTPYHICKMMVECVGDTPNRENRQPLRILDPCCGSGRMLIAAAQTLGGRHEYYGIDIDETCVKMTALNLFLNGVFHGEVMWANSLDPDDFRGSYALSFFPLGIFHITEKENSLLWQMHQNSFLRPRMEPPLLPEGEETEGSQLQLF